MPTSKILHPIVTGHEATTTIAPKDQTISLNLGTLLSETPLKVESGNYAHLQGIMQNVYRDVMNNPVRKKKYESFLKGAFKLDRLWRKARLPNPEERFRVFVLTYAQQRLFDDIIDGDAPTKPTAQARVLYAEEKLQRFTAGTFDESDPVEAFAVRILDDIRTIDPTYVDTARERLALIMRSITFDGHRILERERTGTWQFFSKDELEKHFFDLDIDGTTGLTLFLFGLTDAEKNMAIMKPLGQVSRVAYNLQDFSDDIIAGLCNIPKEDAVRLGITDAHLSEVVTAGKNILLYPENVRTWLREQVARGQKLLKDHGKQPLTRLNMSYPSRNIGTWFRNYGYRLVVKIKVCSGVYVKEAKEVFADFNEV